MSDRLVTAGFPEIERPHFHAFPGLRSATVQTILAGLNLGLGRLSAAPPSERREILLEDGDRLLLAVSTPETWTPERGSVVLLHGLCGCEASPHLVRMARRVYDLGLRSVRVNARSSGPGEGLARGLPHGGRSEDLGSVLRALRRQHPDHHSVVIGFSLGGNIAVKYAGERPEDAADGLRAVVAVGAPLELAEASRRLSRLRNRAFELYFLRLMRRMVLQRHRRYPELGAPDLPRRWRLWDFDDSYTAPQSGYRSAEEYYDRCSAARVMDGVRVPTWLLCSRDDPFVPAWTRPSSQGPIRVSLTDRGGHLGYFAHPRSESGLYWLDRALLAFLADQGMVGD